MHPYVAWRRVALWSNSSWAAKAAFYTGVFGVCWFGGVGVMEFTDSRANDPKHLEQLRAGQSVDQRAQTDQAMATVQKLLDDVKSGKDAKRDWKPI